MYARFVAGRVRAALEDTPVVLVVGPRRSGKTTLVRQLARADRAYLTLDDQTTLDAARADPVGFVRALDQATIDEVQRVPELLLAIKKSVDDDYRPGRFLLTGSSQVMNRSRVADSLAGRVETLRLLPLAQAEIAGSAPSFLEQLFEAELQVPGAAHVGEDLMSLVLAGGFPESIRRPSEGRRQDWGRAYLDSVLTRDLRDVADVDRMTDLPRFVRLVALHAGQLVNYSNLGASIGVSYKTAQRYIGLLEAIFLISTLSPWSGNELKRLTRTPKVHFLDSGLLAATRGVTLARTRAQKKEYGPVLETFVYSELLKLAAGSAIHANLYHFRDHSGNEVDIVMERDDGTLIGIEVKASATVAARDFSGLKKLSEATRERFAFGAVLYDGDTVVPFGPKLAAVPIASLWG